MSHSLGRVRRSGGLSQTPPPAPGQIPGRSQGAPTCPRGSPLPSNSQAASRLFQLAPESPAKRAGRSQDQNRPPPAQARLRSTPCFGRTAAPSHRLPSTRCRSSSPVCPSSQPAFLASSLAVSSPVALRLQPCIFTPARDQSQSHRRRLPPNRPLHPSKPANTGKYPQN